MKPRCTLCDRPTAALDGVCRKCQHVPPPVPAFYTGPAEGPSRAEISACPKCHNTVLREDAVSKSCLTCGTEIFLRDGHWLFERYRRASS
jgi:hypothetical protein